MSTIKENTEYLKQTALSLGFDFCAVAKATYLDDDARRLETWLSKGMHGNMMYMENYFDLRVDPRKLVPGAKSVITLLLNYYPGQQDTVGSVKVSKYAYGKDYHEVIKGKLNEFLYRIQEEIGAVNGRGFIDSAPVLERAWATKSGLGWIGKNGKRIRRFPIVIPGEDSRIEARSGQRRTEVLSDEGCLIGG